jgi:DNA-binding CsgD family transcriptional regulator
VSKSIDARAHRMPSFREIDEFLRELQEAARHLDSAAFRTWVLERVRERVPFVSGCWTVGAAKGGELPHDVAIVGAAPRSGESSHVFWYRDPVLDRQPTVALRFERAPTDRAFDPEERELLALYASQACGAWRGAEQTSLLRQLCRSSQVAALVDSHGYVRAVRGPFYAALRASWPDWHDDRVPAELRTALPAGHARTERGHRWSVEDAGGLLLVTVRPVGAVAVLTDREKAVAAAVLDAGSQQAAAHRLRISINTVRNTLARVYTKLGVRDRVELAMRFRPELASQASSYD